MNTSLNRMIGVAKMLAQVCMSTPFEQCRYSGRDEVHAVAQRHGLTTLGSGNWSTTYAFDDNSYVVKVCFAAATDSSLTYMAWCRAHQHLPHVPKVYHLQRYKSGVYIAVLDRLRRMNHYDHEAFNRASNGLYANDNDDGSSEYATGTAIREFFMGVCGFDFHDENAMVNDETGELVITDPLSYINSHEVKSGMDKAYGVDKAA